jgi:zinc transporter ZupT
VSTGVGAVFLAALATALATGLGALPFLSVRSNARAWLGLATAAAAGCMIAAAALLGWEGARTGIGRMILGAVLGAGALALVQRALRRRGDPHLGVLRGADARRGVAILVAMTAHSFAEGIGVGVAFGDGKELGIVIAVAIAVHNIPEGLAISAVLVPRGTRVAAAAGWCIFSSLPQPLMAIPAFLFVESFGEVLPAGLGFAAGAMVWMVATELVPDARANGRPWPLAVSFAVTFAAMMAFQIVLAGL